MARLDHLGVTFHAKLGTQGERVERIRAAGARRSRRWSAPIPTLAARAAVLAKADLHHRNRRRVPRAAGRDGPQICAAAGRESVRRRRHRGALQAAGARPTRVPTDPVSIAVALADKLDTLVGFWAIDEKPTGSQGPLCAAPRGAGRDPDRCRERAELCRSIRSTTCRCCVTRSAARRQYRKSSTRYFLAAARRRHVRAELHAL